MTDPAKFSILKLMSKVLGAQFAGASWDGWRVILKAMFALPFEDGELETFEALTGRTSAPTEAAREVWAICGRRAGKSIMSALVAVYLTTCREYKDLAPGERGVFIVIAADRRQARVVRRYISGLLHSTPVLEQLIARETKIAIELTTGIAIEIHTASFRTVRGYTVVGAVLDELAFFPTDDAADPDREIIAALRPAMATIRGAVLLCLSSPYARKGELYKAHRAHYAKDGDVLVIQAPTWVLNATVPQEVIDRAYAGDEASALAEYGAQFRLDVESFVSREAIDSAVIPGRLELPLVRGERYVGFLDFAGGSGADSATLAVAHEEERDEQKVFILDAIREVRPPFSPEQVCADFASFLRRYGIATATADRWAGQFPVEQMAKYGVTVKQSAKAKSEIYKEFLPLLNSGNVELLDVPRLLSQIACLERRVARGGRDSIDHAPGSHDDVANAAAGALTLITTGPRPVRVVEARWG